MPEALSAHVGLATLLLLCYRLLFCSDREPSLTGLLFCGACAWCAGQLAAGAAGEVPGVPLASSAAAAAAAAREACWRYTQPLAADEPEPPAGEFR